MTNRFIIPFLFFLAYLFLINAQGCKEINCENGYEPENGTCACPKDKFETGGLCKSLEENEYFGIVTKCSCNDSAFFKVNYNYVYPSGDTVTLIKMRIGPNNAESNLPFISITKPDGDSLVGKFELSPSRCKVQGWHSSSRMRGKFSKDKSLLKLYVYNETDYPIEMKYLRDTCIYICRR